MCASLGTEQFAALYGSLGKNDRYLIMGWSRDFTSIGDPETVVELLCFVEDLVELLLSLQLLG